MASDGTLRHNPRAFFDSDGAPLLARSAPGARARVEEVLNVCFAEHELVSDHVDACLDFFATASGSPG